MELEGIPIIIKNFPYAAARSFVFLALLPVGDLISFTQKIIMGLLLSAAIACQQPAFHETCFLTGLLQNIAYGFISALPLTAFLGLLPVFGEFVDAVRGQMTSVANSPLWEGSYSPLSSMLQYWGFALVCFSGSLLKIIILLVSPDTVHFDAYFFTAKAYFILTETLHMFSSILLPACLIALIVELLTLFFSKFIFPLHGSTESFSLKTVLMVFVFLGYSEHYFYIDFLKLLGEIIN